MLDTTQYEKIAIKTVKMPQLWYEDGEKDSTNSNLAKERTGHLETCHKNDDSICKVEKTKAKIQT